MGEFLVMGDVTMAGRKHRNGATIAFEGVPNSLGLRPLDSTREGKNCSASLMTNLPRRIDFRSG